MLALTYQQDPKRPNDTIRLKRIETRFRSSYKQLRKMGEDIAGWASDRPAYKADTRFLKKPFIREKPRLPGRKFFRFMVRGRTVIPVAWPISPNSNQMLIHCLRQTGGRCFISTYSVRKMVLGGLTTTTTKFTRPFASSYQLGYFNRKVFYSDRLKNTMFSNFFHTAQKYKNLFYNTIKLTEVHQKNLVSALRVVSRLSGIRRSECLLFIEKKKKQIIRNRRLLKFYMLKIKRFSVHRSFIVPSAVEPLNQKRYTFSSPSEYIVRYNLIRRFLEDKYKAFKVSILCAPNRRWRYLNKTTSFPLFKQVFNPNRSQTLRRLRAPAFFRKKSGLYKTRLYFMFDRTRKNKRYRLQSIRDRSKLIWSEKLRQMFTKYVNNKYGDYEERLYTLKKILFLFNRVLKTLESRKKNVKVYENENKNKNKPRHYKDQKRKTDISKKTSYSQKVSRTSSSRISCNE